VASRWFGAGRSKTVVGKCEVKRPLGRTGIRREDKIKMNFQDIEWGGAWNGLIWLRIGRGGGLL
jgi:hypothetical protein